MNERNFKQECKNDEQKLSKIFDPSLKKHRKENKPQFRRRENCEEDQQYFDLLEPFYKIHKIVEKKSIIIPPPVVCFQNKRTFFKCKYYL